MNSVHLIHHFVGLCTALVLLVSPLQAADLDRGAEIFTTNCATCHGPAGSPDPDSPLVKGLGVVPADFSDTLFNSREGEGEWKLVATYGGASLGFSEVMPAFGNALSEDDIDNVLAYIKTLGGEHNYPDGSLNLFLPLRTRKAFPEDEWVWKQRYTEQDGDNVWKNALEYEFRVADRWQGVIEVVHTVEGSEAEFEYFEPGFKYVLSHDKQNGFIATLGGNLVLPLNSDTDWGLLPYFAIGKVINDQWIFQGSSRLKLNMEDFDKNKVEFAGIVHWTHTPWPRRVFPALEVVADIPFERGSGPDKQSWAQWSIVPQARIGLNKRGHVALNVGVELPLNDTERYDWQAYVYLIWDFADGGFFEAW